MAISQDEELDALTRRMGEINLALQTSHREPSPERFALLEELDGLRDRASRFREDRDRHQSKEQLEAELAALRSELDRFNVTTRAT